jgi:6-phosphogluconate dehydrogenase
MMELGMIGLGRMGANMTVRLLGGGHRVVAFDRDLEKVGVAVAKGASPARSLTELVGALKPPRVVWVMVPAGAATTAALQELETLLAPDDVIIEGGNSFYKDSIERAARARARGLHYLDAGTSGGVWGLSVGYCLMVGGEREIFRRCEALFATLAPPNGYAYVGPSGAGHFSKMVHNGIEYGLLQAYAEGFELLAAAPFRLDLKQLASLWNHGSVVRSWLLELAEEALGKDARLDAIAGFVEDSGEGRWTVQTAVEQSVPLPAITAALFARFASRQDDSFAAKFIAALRREFGGHATKSP